MGDLIRLVETAYELQADDRAWLAHVLDAMARHLFPGVGMVACFYDRNAPAVDDMVYAFMNRDLDERFIAAIRSAFATGSPADRDRSLRAGPVVRLSSLLGGPVGRDPHYGPLAGELGFADAVGLHVANVDGTGAYFGALLRHRHRDARRWDARWSRVAAHFAAALRLQRAAATVDLEVADAVLAPDGRVVALRASAEAARERLRSATIAIDRARGALRRRDVAAALDAWEALVGGRWSLVDHFESDGKRFVVALPNAPTALDPRALSDIERTIAGYVALGHTNKLIAYELGIPSGTVGTRISAIARKLGVRSRVEIADRVQLLQSATFASAQLASSSVIIGAAPLATREARLTTAEREVAELAARGASNAQIAGARGSALRTVANLLASAYRKLGVGSRAQLARTLHDTERK